MKMTRQASLIKLLAEHETLTTDALAGQLGVSKETIRRDLKALQTQGKLSGVTVVRAYFTRRNRMMASRFTPGAKVTMPIKPILPATP